jgi:hypothetical protein
MKSGTVVWTQWWAALARKRFARVVGAFARAPRSTPLGCRANQSVGGIFSTRESNTLQKPCKTSGWAAVYSLQGGSIRKKIIGHGMRSIVPGFSVTKPVRRPRPAISLLQKQARQHGSGVLLHPLVQQSGDLLAEIGGMREPRQPKTLQGVP